MCNPYFDISIISESSRLLNRLLVMEDPGKLASQLLQGAATWRI